METALDYFRVDELVKQKFIWSRVNWEYTNMIVDLPNGNCVTVNDNTTRTSRTWKVKVSRLRKYAFNKKIEAI